MGADEVKSAIATVGGDDLPTVDSTAGAAVDGNKLLAELTQLTSDFQNYRKRADKQLAESVDFGKAAALGALLEVLDDIELARSHGEVAGGFKSVADKLGSSVASLGLGRFGEVGDEFDPKIHEAVVHEYRQGVSKSSVGAVLRSGYKFKGALLRPAQVLVIEPEESR